MGSDISEIPSTAAKTNEPVHGDFCTGPNLMVMVPGLFQTLDTMEKAVLPLLEAHPDLTVLLVAPPGLPNTHWPATVSLDGEVLNPAVLFPGHSRGCLCWCEVITGVFMVELGVAVSNVSR